MDITRFNPHAMADTQIQLLSTGRDKLIETVAKALTDGKGVRQHVLITAPRGFGKSFFVRAVEIAIEELSTNVRVCVLPEEQRNVTTPSGFLREIARALKGAPASTVTGQFLDDPKGAWEEARSELEAVLCTLDNDQIAIVAIENFGELIKTVFNNPADESKLRSMLSESKRLGILATALHAEFDQDYERRLFHAFAKFTLTPWSDQDHIRYFERRAVLEGHDPNDLDRGRIKALAQFTGGSPRMAVALADLLLENDPMGAAALLDKLVDELTPYYQNLVEQMPARTRTLFDALIRQSEPCSQSELAERVGTTQNRIAQHFSWLRERHLVVGKKRSGKREYLYQVSDRLFVQYYRKRYLLHDNYTPLAGMAELLDGFFSAAQNREQILMLMENGRLDEATEFVRAALFRNQGELGDWVQKTDNRTAIEALAASENGDHRLAIDLYRKALIMADIDEDRVGKALILGQLGLNASHLRRFSDAIVAHQKALEIWQSQDKPAVTAWVLSQLAQEFRGALQFDNALKYAKMALKIWKSRGAEDRVASIWGEIGENLRQIGRSEEAVDAYLRAEEFWKSKKDGAAVGWTLGGIGLARRDVGRFREAIQSHKQALEALETVPTRKRSMALNLGWIASSHRMLTEYSEALENDQAALQIFEEMNEPRRLIKTLSSISLNYLGLNDFGNAFSNLQKAFDIAVESNFQDQIIWTTAQLCHLHLNVGEPMQILKQLDKSPVLDTHKLYETVLTKCGSALGLIEERDGRAAAFKEGLKVLEGLLLRDEHVPANESMTYLLSGLLESQRAFPLLQDLAFEAASMEGGLSDLRRKALELSTKFIVNRDDESLLENIDPDVSAAVRAIIDASKSRRRNGEA